jgi:hypothetical protein
MGLEIWREITTEYNGRAIKGSFKFLDGVVTVRTLRGSKAAQVRGQTPERGEDIAARVGARGNGLKSAPDWLKPASADL